MNILAESWRVKTLQDLSEDERTMVKKELEGVHSLSGLPKKEMLTAVKTYLALLLR